MTTYTYEKNPISAAQILASTGLSPTTYGKDVLILESFEFPVPLTADEQAQLDQFMTDLGYSPVAHTGATVPLIYSFSGQIVGALGLVTKFFANVGVTGLVFNAANRFPVVAPIRRAKIGVLAQGNTLATATTFALSISGAAASASPTAVVPAGTNGYFTGSGDIIFNDGDQIDLVATNTAGGLASILNAAVTVQLYQ